MEQNIRVMDTIKRVGGVIIYAIAALSLSLVLFTSFVKPWHQGFHWQAALSTVIITGFFFAIYYFGTIKGLFDKISDRVYYILLIALGIALFSFYSLSSDMTFYEFSMCTRMAEDVAAGEGFPTEIPVLGSGDYIMPTLFLSVSYKIARVLSIPDFYPMLFINVLTVVLSAWAIGYLLSTVNDKSPRIHALILLAACLPLYVHTGIFEGNKMSFGLAIVSLALIKKALSATKGGIIWVILAGLILAYAVEMKKQLCIPVIAFICVLLIKSALKNWKYLALFLAVTVLTMLGLYLWSNSYPSAVELRKNADPVISRIAIGCLNDGKHVNYSSWVALMKSLNHTKEEKIEFSKQLISSNAKHGYIFAPERIIGKVRENFADGSLGAGNYLGNMMYDFKEITYLFIPGATKYYETASAVTLGYMIMFYIVFFAGCIKAIAVLLKRKPIPLWKAVSDMSYLLVFLYLMIFVADNGQLYSQIPIFIIGLIANADFLLKKERA